MLYEAFPNKKFRKYGNLHGRLEKLPKFMYLLRHENFKKVRENVLY